jgi:hypothetical protein
VAEDLGQNAVRDQLRGEGFEDAGRDLQVAGDLGERGRPVLRAAAETFRVPRATGWASVSMS